MLFLRKIKYFTLVFLAKVLLGKISFVTFCGNLHFSLLSSLQKTKFIPSPHGLSHCGFPWKNLVLFLSLQSSLHNSFVIYAQNWFLDCSFPCKRLNLSHHQFDFCSLVFLEKPRIIFHSSLPCITPLFFSSKIIFLLQFSYQKATYIMFRNWHFILVFLVKILCQFCGKFHFHCSLSCLPHFLFCVKCSFLPLTFLKKKSPVIFAQNYIFHSSFPCITPLLFMRKIQFFNCSFLWKRLN